MAADPPLEPGTPAERAGNEVPSAPIEFFSRRVTDGGIAGNHEIPERPTVLVAPRTEQESNAIRAGLIPVACLRLDDVRFEFDSSFIQPGIGEEMERLGELFDEHPPQSLAKAGSAGFPVSIFGHADPVGNDDYNKRLSGRRAMAVYGLLTRDADLWEDLFAHPHGNDAWGQPALQTMADTVSADASQGNDIKPFQRDRKLRLELYGRYMERLCGPLRLQKADFLGRGEDKGGKGDFQGCGEFNPSLVFSAGQQAAFLQPSRKRQRDIENAPNRRVLVLLFRAGSRIAPSKWPCPRAAEGTAGCVKRLFSDADVRRSKRLPDKPRRYEDTRDTFACRFYDRLVVRSPCEGAVRVWVIRLLEDGPEPLDQRKPLVNAPFTVTGVGAGIPEIRGTTNARGVLRIVVKDDPTTMLLKIAGQEITVLAGSLVPLDSGVAGVVQRLENLGFGIFEREVGTAASADDATVSGSGLIAGLDRFQQLHGLPQRSAPDAGLREKLHEFYGS